MHRKKKEEQSEVAWAAGCLMVPLIIIFAIIMGFVSEIASAGVTLLVFFLSVVFIVIALAYILSYMEKVKRERQEELMEKGLKSLEISGKIEGFSGEDFERMVAKIFSKTGYSVSTTKGVR